MTFETGQQTRQDLSTTGGGGAPAARALGTTLQEVGAVIGRFGDVAHADACVGPVQTVDGHTVFPLASVSLTAGFGMGFGGGEDGGGQGQGSGGGGGGGGRGSSRVIALVDVSEHEVKVRPIPDITAMTLGLMVLAGMSIIALRGRPGGGLLRLLRLI